MSEFTTIEGALEYFRFACEGVRAEGAINVLEAEWERMRSGLKEAWRTSDEYLFKLCMAADELKLLRERNEELHIEKRQALATAQKWAYRVHQLERERDAATDV